MENAQKYKVLITNFLVFFCVYGIYIFNNHYSSDSYSVFAGGMANINLENGRPLTWLLYTILDGLGLTFYRNIQVSQTILLIVITIISLQVYQCFYYISDKTETTCYIIQATTILFFVNASFAEGWFGFPEICFGSAIHTYLAYLAFFCFVKAYNGKKVMLCISYIILFFAVSMYQIYVALFVSLCTFYILAATKGRFSRRDIIYEFQMVLATVACALLNIGMMAALTYLGVTSGNPRIAATGDSLIKNVIWLLQVQKSVWKDFFGYIPNGVMGITGILIVFCLVTFCKKKKLKNIFWVILFLIGCYFTVFSVHLPASIIWCTPRTIYSFFVLIAGSICLIVYSDYKKIFGKIVLAVQMVVILAFFVRVQAIAVNNIALNRIDEEVALAVQREIDCYEKDTGQIVTTIKVGNDGAKAPGYISIDYTMADTNVRAYAIDWSNIEALNYYTGRSYEKIIMTQEEKNKYFSDMNYDFLDLEAQIYFHEECMYWLIY